MVYVILNFDDYWSGGPSYPNLSREAYFEQIDQYLCQNAIPEIELVFYNKRTPFRHKSISMKCATVVNDE